MCSIFGIKSKNTKLFGGQDSLSHRGPDGFGQYSNDENIFLRHNRLSIIGLDANSSQPMKGADGSILIFNGEIYNFEELKTEELAEYRFRSNSDTEVILALYEKHGVSCLDYLRGMFAFAIWDEKRQRLFCARDRFGIKPLYFHQSKDCFVFGSEIKALLPYLKGIITNREVLSEYFAFQYTLGSETLFKDIYQLMPGHFLQLEKDNLIIKKYWDINYTIDHDSSEKYFEEKLEYLIKDSVKYHLVSDVPVGSYLSGGLDSSLITILAQEENESLYGSFHGSFPGYDKYNEEYFARSVNETSQKNLLVADITPKDFTENIFDIIYYLDTPVAGPGAFPQYMVSKLASEHVKVVLGGQGGDELFGGYARYIIAYFEQCIKAAIDGTHKNGKYVVTPESIIPNLTLLQEYKPLMKSFWKDGLFGPLDERYYRLVDRSNDTEGEVNWELFDKADLLEKFKAIFNNSENVGKEAYFDKMTHFDFKCLLPALLTVEDRMSMAHGLESRVPFLDHPLVEYAATIPADIKFPGGKMKNLLKKVFQNKIPPKILHRRDKMGFPVPLKEWFEGPLREFVHDIFLSQKASTRGFYDPKKVLENLDNSSQFSRKIWGLLSLEIWHQQFHDKEAEFSNRST